MKTVWIFLKTNRSIIFLIIIIILAVKVFIPQLDDLKDSISALKEADPTWMLLGTIVFFLGVPVLAWQYVALALKPIPYLLTLRVEMAGLFVSKLLPSSLGTLTLNLYYLTQQKHTILQSSTVMAMNAVTSGIAYAILMLLALIASSLDDASYSIGSTDINVELLMFILFGFILFCFVLYQIPKIKQKVRNGIADTVENLKAYKQNPRAVVMGILLNGIGSATSVFAMYASAHAIGVDLSMSNALLAYTFGNIAMALVPTPGGLGAAEAGIYAGLVLVGIDATDAVVITMLYRLITYWLPIVPGYYYFWSLRKTVLSDFSINSKPTQVT